MKNTKALILSFILISSFSSCGMLDNGGARSTVSDDNWSGAGYCTNINCPSGQICNPASGACILISNNLCQNITCSNPQVCDMTTGQCITIGNGSGTPCQNGTWSLTGMAPCTNCPTANGDGTSLPSGMGCNCDNNGGFTWDSSSGTCTGIASSTPCVNGTYSATGFEPVSGVCTDCSNIANSDGTSSSPYTSCNCISSDYIWASGVCVYTFYDLFYL